MEDEWSEVSLGKLFRVKHGFAFKGEYFTDEIVKTVLVTPGNFSTNGEFKNSKPKYYNGPVPDGYRLRPGQVIVSMTDLSKATDTLGYAVRVPEDNYEWLHNQRIGLLEFESTSVDPLFIAYLLRSNEYRSWIVGSATGTTVKHTSPKRISAYTCRIPPLDVQRAIGSVLVAFDEKVELNRQTNETLESMAQALFKSWFVDFDPVIDNTLAAGNDIPEPFKARAAARQALGDARKPLPEAIRREFPDTFEFRDEMGWVPQGWKIFSLDSIAEYRNGLALQKFRPADDSEYLPVLKIAQLRVDEPTHAEKASVDIPEDYIVRDGDVVFSWSGSLILRIWCGGRAALNQHLFRVTSKQFPKWFYFGWTEAHLGEFKKAAADKAVTMGHIKRSHLKEAKCVIPTNQLMQYGTGYFAPIIDRQIATRLESRALGSLRDTLLPKLLSGELTLPDAEKLAAEAL